RSAYCSRRVLRGGQSGLRCSTDALNRVEAITGRIPKIKRPRQKPGGGEEGGTPSTRLMWIKERPLSVTKLTFTDQANCYFSGERREGTVPQEPQESFHDCLHH